MQMKTYLLELWKIARSIYFYIFRPFIYGLGESVALHRSFPALYSSQKLRQHFSRCLLLNTALLLTIIIYTYLWGPLLNLIMWLFQSMSITNNEDNQFTFGHPTFEVFLELFYYLCIFIPFYLVSQIANANFYKNIGKELQHFQSNPTEYDHHTKEILSKKDQNNNTLTNNNNNNKINMQDNNVPLTNDINTFDTTNNEPAIQQNQQQHQQQRKVEPLNDILYNRLTIFKNKRKTTPDSNHVDSSSLSTTTTTPSQLETIPKSTTTKMGSQPIIIQQQQQQQPAAVSLITKPMEILTLISDNISRVITFLLLLIEATLFATVATFFNKIAQSYYNYNSNYNYYYIIISWLTWLCYIICLMIAYSLTAVGYSSVLILDAPTPTKNNNNIDPHNNEKIIQKKSNTNNINNIQDLTNLQHKLLYLLRVYRNDPFLPKIALPCENTSELSSLLHSINNESVAAKFIYTEYRVVYFIAFSFIMTILTFDLSLLLSLSFFQILYPFFFLTSLFAKQHTTILDDYILYFSKQHCIKTTQTNGQKGALEARIDTLFYDLITTSSTADISSQQQQQLSQSQQQQAHDKQLLGVVAQNFMNLNNTQQKQQHNTNQHHNSLIQLINQIYDYALIYPPPRFPVFNLVREVNDRLLLKIQAIFRYFHYGDNTNSNKDSATTTTTTTAAAR